MAEKLIDAKAASLLLGQMIESSAPSSSANAALAVVWVSIVRSLPDASQPLRAELAQKDARIKELKTALTRMLRPQIVITMRDGKECPCETQPPDVAFALEALGKSDGAQDA